MVVVAVVFCLHIASIVALVCIGYITDFPCCIYFLQQYNGMLQFWVKPILPRGSYAIAVLYLKQSGYPIRASANLADLGLYKSSRYRFSEVFDGHDIGIFTRNDNITCHVTPPGIVLLKAVAVK